MSKLSKVLSVLLAMVLLFSTASIGVEAAYNAYKDNAITRYDSIDKPVLTSAQYASMAMDEVDRMLAEANLKIEYDLAGLITISADFTSVDKALDSVADIYNSVKSMFSTIGGDIENLDFSALVNANGSLVCPKRGTAGKTDADIFISLLEFLADNAEIIAKVPKGTLDLGILSGFINISEYLDIQKLAKEALAKLVWPDKEKDQLDLTKTVDQYVEILIDEIASGNYAKFKNGIGAIKTVSSLLKQYLPGITDQIDLLNDSVYDLINKGLKVALNSVAVPYANSNNRMQGLLRKLCGYDYTKMKDEEGDPYFVRPANPKDEVNAMVNVINLDFHMDPFPINEWGNDWIFDHLNDIIGLIVREVIKPDVAITWDYSRGNDALKDNIISVAKTVLANTGDALFASYIEVLSPEEINAMGDDAFLAYVLRSILNASISFVYIPNTSDTVEEVLFDLVKSLAADFVPSRDYSDLDADLDGIIAIGLDMAVYGLNGITNMDLEYGLNDEEFADECMTWVEDNYGGFVDSIEGNSGWEKLSYIFFNIIPANWLSTKEDGSERDDLYDLIFSDLVENILNFDLAAVLELLDQNEDGELNDTIIEVLMARLTGIVNYVLPDVFPAADYSHLENLLNPNLLSTIVENLLNSLYDRAQNGLLDALIPVVCSALGLSSAETFGYPYISLEDQHTVGQVLLTSFYMYNGSGGINTNATDKNGRQTQDKLYTYHILSVETNNDDVTVSPNSNIYINGGTSQTFTLSNVSAAKDTVLKVKITYDVLGEKGTVMTPNPLTATTYTYIYDSGRIKEDDEKDKADASNKNTHLVIYKPTTYMSADSTLGDLAEYTMDLQRNKWKDTSLHTVAATFSISNATIDPALASAGVSANMPFSVSTTERGGAWEYAPYKVTNKDAQIPEGNYTNTFQFDATKTENEAERITLSHSVFVYDDFGLGSLLRSAVNADRQEANFAKDGGHTAKYLQFGVELPEAPEKFDDQGNITPEYAQYLVDIEQYYTEETVNGADAWDRYVEAVDAAAAIVYAPKQVGTMQTFVDNGDFENAAMELYAAAKELDACSVSGGTANIKAALDAVVTPDTYIDPETGEEETYDYDDARHTYFGRADYVNYTYSNFKSERRTAERILDAEKAAIKKGEDYQIEAIRAAYVAHRVSLYGERLVRVRAYKTYLAQAIQDYTPIYNAGKGDYNSKTWNDFIRWYNFALQVNNEAIGATVPGSENLQGDGLRQTKVNEARAQLVKAAKRLSTEWLSVNYEQINEQIAQVKATYDAGISNYTALSWNSFKAAYDAAVAVVASNLELTDENQELVNSKYRALKAAFEALVEEVIEEGDWSFDPDSFIQTTNTMFSGFDYIIGLFDYYINVSDYVITEGSYDVQVELNEWDMESTGAIVKVYDGDDLIGEYPIVFFSDINGDGVSDGTDVTELVNAQGFAGLTDWEDFGVTDENPYAMAADLDHSGVLDGTDLSIMVQIQGYTIEYNQAWQSEDDEIYYDL